MLKLFWIVLFLFIWPVHVYGCVTFNCIIILPSFLSVSFYITVPIDAPLCSLGFKWMFPLRQTHRESIYQVLSQTTPENCRKNYVSYSIDPKTRYLRVNLSSIQAHQVSAAILSALNTDISFIFMKLRARMHVKKNTSSHKSKAMRNYTLRSDKSTVSILFSIMYFLYIYYSKTDDTLNGIK